MNVKPRYAWMAGWILGLAGALVASGCGPRDPLAAHVDAETPEALASWRRRAERLAPGPAWPELTEMLRELRLASSVGRDEPAADRAVCERIRGKTLREVLVLGHQARLARLRKEGTELLEVAQANGLLVTKPDDTASATYLAAFRERQGVRLKTLETAIAATEARIRELGGNVSAASRVPLDPTPPALTRDQAKKEVMELIAAGRAGLASKYGTEPVEFDHDGLRLTGDQRTEFLARRAALRDRAEGVVAVRIQRQWWLYEGPRAAPSWPAAVRAALTADDLALFERAWFDLQAERWARQKAAGKSE